MTVRALRLRIAAEHGGLKVELRKSLQSDNFLEHLYSVQTAYAKGMRELNDHYCKGLLPLVSQLLRAVSLCHTLTINCTCCDDEIKGTQVQDLFSCSFSDSLSAIMLVVMM